MKSKMQSLLDEWAKRQGGYLHQKFALLHNRKFDDASDAAALCAALHSERADEVDGESFETCGIFYEPAWYTIAWMFTRAETKEIRDIIRKKGLPLLQERLVKALSEDAEWDAHGRLTNGSPKHYLLILKLLAHYQDDQDLPLTIMAARNARFEGHLDWDSVFEQFLGNHPRQIALLDSLRHPLPTRWPGLAYLDYANTLFREGHRAQHPFDSEVGLHFLQQLLKGESEFGPETGVSATAALPFLRHPGWFDLLGRASKHDNIHVKMEAAWIGAKHGVKSAIDQLKAWLKDPRYHDKAKVYLEELKIYSQPSPEVSDPNFRAAVEMNSWLSHPLEFAYPPDSLELLDTRVLYWPPTKDTRQIWLFTYSYVSSCFDYAPRRAVGIVGTTTFSYSDASPDMAVEDLYALFCVREQHWLMKTGNQTIAYGRAQLSERNEGF